MVTTSLHRYAYRGRRRVHTGQSRLWIAGPVIALTSLFITPTPAQASNAPVVMVESHLSGRYDVLLRRSAKYTDRFTLSRMVFGKCVSDKRCIRVRNDNTLRKGTGWTTCGLCPRSDIGIHPAWQRDDTYWQRLLEHELGHAYGLAHSSSHSNIMFPPILYHGHVVPEKYTPAQQAILRRY